MSSGPVKLHDTALRLIQWLMVFLLVVPPRPQVQLKMLYSGVLLIYLVLITRWRLAFNYTANYDHLHDNFSRIIDLVNFAALVMGHSIVSMELLWGNRSDQIEMQFIHIHNVLRERIGRKVNHRRIRNCTNTIFILLLIRVIMLLGMTIYNYVNTITALQLICSFYSELVLVIRCSEFTLHASLILTIYQELRDAGSDLISELESTRFEIWSKRNQYLERIATLRRLHLLLWQTQRDIELNFERSLIVVMMKYFMDNSVLPYWAYLNRLYSNNFPMQLWCTAEEVGKLMEICTPCWICTRCSLLQRQFRSIFHAISVDRRNELLNTTLLRISSQLGQEISQFRIGGLIIINNEMLGKFLFGMFTYIFICIQFRITYIGKVTYEAEAALRLNNLTSTIEPTNFTETEMFEM